ncbi:MAG: FAD-binding oxidoreductase [Candidatus Cloacimonetes bacterium]|nr:FAD-binding oxidoreductase [Candidatus Cloacimonadota bacterium]
MYLNRNKNTTSWGNYPQVDALSQFIEREKDVNSLDMTKKLIARGLGRSYGDSALSKSIVNLEKNDYFISFSNEGILECTAGVSLESIISVFSTRGWFLPVTPGTKYVTVGGAIASDVHGKNHHADGVFSDHVESFRIFTGEEILECSKSVNPDLFYATCGGMGLTGIILTVTLRLLKIHSSYIIQSQTRASNFEDLMRLFEGSESEKYTVAWIDCLSKGEHLGRGVMISGEHATYDDLLGTKMQENPLKLCKSFPAKIPFNFPSFALCSESVYLFNQLYFNKPSSELDRALTTFDPFFYPLDFVSDWNKIYGARGFVQYQFVVPMKSSKKAIQEILERVSDKGIASFLAVLKLFGKESEGYLSFPMRGYTLALDFPIMEGLFEFLDELDKIVLDANGRLYLTKDARMSADTFHKSYKNVNKFKSVVQKYGCDRFFKSLQAKRLGL